MLRTSLQNKICVQLSLALLAAFAVQVLLSWHGKFSSTLGGVVGGLILAVGLATAVRMSGLLSATSGGWWRWLWIPVTACWLMLWAHPTERIFGGHDEGTYAATAVSLWRQGDLRHPAPADFAGAVGELGTRQVPSQGLMRTREIPRYPSWFDCLFADPSRSDRMLSQFPPGQTVLMASCYSLGGWWGLRWMNNALIFASAAILGGLVARWAGAAGGLLAFSAALWFPLHVWIGNTFYAEPAVQWMFLTAVMAWTLVDAMPWRAVLINSLVAACAPLVKADAAPLSVVCGVWLAWYVAARWRDRELRPAMLAGIVSLVVAVGLSFSVLWDLCRFYLEDSLTVHWQKAAGIAVAAVVGGLVLLWWRNRIPVDEAGTGDASSRRWSRSARYVLAGSVLIAAAFLWFLRPMLEGDHLIYYWPAGTEILSYRAETFPRIAWYLSIPGLALAVAGVAYMAFRAKESATFLFLLLGGGALFYVAWDIHNNPIQPYAMRRLVPFATPVLLAGFAMLGAKAIAAFRARDAMRGRGRLLAAGIVLGAAVAFLHFALLNQKFDHQKNGYPGTIAAIERLAAKIPPGTTVVLPIGENVRFLAAPLHLIHGIPTVRVRDRPERISARAGAAGLLPNEVTLLFDANSAAVPEWARTSGSGFKTQRIRQVANQLNLKPETLSWDYVVIPPRE